MTKQPPSRLAPRGAVYISATPSYFERREIKHHAGVQTLWALGVGAVISGHFPGWNLGLAVGGRRGMLIAAAGMVVMFLALSSCIAEMSSSLPLNGGSYPFAHFALGPFWRFVSGLCEHIEYFLTPALICYFIDANLGAIFGLEIPEPVSWIGTCAVFLALVTLTLTAFLIVSINPAFEGIGAFALAQSGEPALDGFRIPFGGMGANILWLIAMSGLVASFHAIFFAQGRQIFALSRAGNLPSGVSLTHGARKAPVVAILAGSGLGLVFMLALWTALGASEAGALAGSVLLNVAVFVALLSCLTRAAAFLAQRRNYHDLPRPFLSPSGRFRPWLTICICLLTLACQLQGSAFLHGTVWVVVGLMLALAYYAEITGHRLILTPKEANLVKASTDRVAG